MRNNLLTDDIFAELSSSLDKLTVLRIGGKAEEF